MVIMPRSIAAEFVTSRTVRPPWLILKEVEFCEIEMKLKDSKNLMRLCGWSLGEWFVTIYRIPARWFLGPGNAWHLQHARPGINQELRVGRSKAAHSPGWIPLMQIRCWISLCHAKRWSFKHDGTQHDAGCHWYQYRLRCSRVHI